MFKNALLVLFLSLLILGSTRVCFSQNIVENPSFEYYEYSISTNAIIFLSSNPTNNSSVDSLRCSLSWTNPTESSPDYLIVPWVGSILTPNANAPNSNWGYQIPKTDSAYSHIGCYKDPFGFTEHYREYIQGKLSEPLKAGKDYVFGFYTVLTETSTHASKIGVGFTQDSVYYNTMDCLIGEGFYPDLETTTFYTDTLNWTKVEWVYTASGRERFFTAGNFWYDSTTSFLFVNPNGDSTYNPSSYFVDDFYMYELIDTMGTHDVYIPNIFSPNGDGNNDVFWVRGEGISEIKTFVVYNRWGEEVHNCNCNEIGHGSNCCGWNGTFRGEDAPEGVYAYYVEVVLLNGETVMKRGNVTLVR